MTRTDPERSGPALNLHALVERSRANGPGERMVLWLQGCDLDCPGCFNPDTHGFAPRDVVPVAALAERVVAASDGLEGLTVSGGEPLAQAPALAALLREVRARTRLSIVLFSGYTLGEIRRDAARSAVVEEVDVLVAGRYAARRRTARAMLGSANQRVHLLTKRYGLDALRAVPECEVHIAPGGGVLVTGVAPHAVSSAIDPPSSPAR